MFKRFIFLLFLLEIFLLTQPVKAESYDIYVDKDCQSTQDGSEEKPFCTISKALENASSSKNKIYIKDGVYKEKISLGKNIEIYGHAANSVVIENPIDGSTISGKDGNVIKNITVKGGHNGILFEKGGTIENCIIKDATKNAIDLSPNDGKAEIKKNKITGNAKGIYAEANREVDISNNEISGNSEEGIDLRENIKGFIQNNIITKNGEGGIELIVGSSDLIINNNKITKNNASGIAAQFYSFVNKLGEITISDNFIGENEHYGLTCKNTQGGIFNGSYWGKSIELSNNDIEKNKIRAIDKNCLIVRAVDKEEEAEQEIIKDSEVSDDQKQQGEKETAEEKKQREEEEKREQEESIILKEVNDIDFQLENYLIDSGYLFQEIEGRGKIKVFFFGFDDKKMTELKNLNSQQENNQKRLEELKNLTQKDLVKEKIDSINQNISKTLQENKKIVSEKFSKKGILGWLLDIFS